MTQLFAPMLVVGAIALYLFDSAMLLCANEFVLVRRGGRWRLARPSAIEFSSRRLYLPNPLTPYRVQLRLHWKLAGSDETAVAPPPQEQFLRAVSTVGVAVVPLMIVLASGPVLVGLGLGSPTNLLAWMAVVYVDVICLLAFVYRSRHDLGISPKSFGGLAFECLSCAPFALNIVRKISERRGLQVEPMRFAKEVLDEADAQELRARQQDMRTRLQ